MKYVSFLLVVFLFGCYSKDPEKTGLEGKPLPEFNLLLNDSTTNLNTKNIPNGQPVVLFYFSPHCPYCRSQMEGIIKNITILKDIRFYIITTSPFSEMKNFYEYYELNKYPNITTGVDYRNFFGDYFEAQGVPYMAIYGKDKKLNQAFIGKIYAKQIKKVAEE